MKTIILIFGVKIILIFSVLANSCSRLREPDRAAEFVGRWKFTWHWPTQGPDYDTFQVTEIRPNVLKAIYNNGMTLIEGYVDDNFVWSAKETTNGMANGDYTLNLITRDSMYGVFKKSPIDTAKVTARRL